MNPAGKIPYLCEDEGNSVSCAKGQVSFTSVEEERISIWKMPNQSGHVVKTKLILS
ncbi:hypothetical protein SPSIL_015780 [Sporomusa silvacetica DSM 10669]|uniref:Uncharacterized protein n=1 Tax=Sporomusa silvacetica DSM 10669 TaxID=1123289 RepID=A0ABZ3IJ64_9FIRM|nr:hypothetical protein SPSIL_06950 [Sporomusa silvacetica DSM 10669]